MISQQLICKIFAKLLSIIENFASLITSTYQLLNRVNIRECRNFSTLNAKLYLIDLRDVT